MTEILNLNVFIPAPAQLIYETWLSSDGHAAMTGSPARIDPRPGGEFVAWDGYIWGETLTLEPYRRIIQSWRTTEFPTDAPDSMVTVLLQPELDGTRLILRHTEIPDGQGASYQQGWQEYYFDPMQEYFSKK